MTPHDTDPVWDAALQDPTFVASLDEGLADVAAGRVSAWDMSGPPADPIEDRRPYRLLAVVICALSAALVVGGFWLAIRWVLEAP